MNVSEKKLRQKLNKKQEYDYWFRIMNDGVLPEDSLPYARELEAYKEFADIVQSRALGTLKTTVQRLIDDFESGQVKEYSQSDKQKESKYQALRRLISVINESENAPIEKETTKKQHDSYKNLPLTQEARKTSDIKRLINNLLAEDKEISQLIPKEDGQNN